MVTGKYSVWPGAIFSTRRAIPCEMIGMSNAARLNSTALPSHWKGTFTGGGPMRDTVPELPSVNRLTVLRNRFVQEPSVWKPHVVRKDFKVLHCSAFFLTYR